MSCRHHWMSDRFQFGNAFWAIWQALWLTEKIPVEQTSARLELRVKVEKVASKVENAAGRAVPAVVLTKNVRQNQTEREEGASWLCQSWPTSELLKNEFVLITFLKRKGENFESYSGKLPPIRQALGFAFITF